MNEFLFMLRCSFYYYDAETRWVGKDSLSEQVFRAFGPEACFEEMRYFTDKDCEELAAIFDKEGADIQYGVQYLTWVGDGRINPAYMK